MLNVECLTVFPPFMANCFVVRREDAPERAILVDPGGDAPLIREWLKRLGITSLEAIWLTHGHLDHLGAVAEVLQAHPGIPVWIHEAEARWCSSALLNGSETFGCPYTPFEPTNLWKDADEFSALGTTWRILHTPGHSPGSVCIMSAEAGIAFSGDLILYGATGRTDLPGGDNATIFRSLDRLARTPGELHLYPGHGEMTTLSDERRHNPYVQHAVNLFASTKGAAS
jgi:hydroxyacylglutathione hydrolase